MDGKISIRTISEMSGFSPATVSNVLNGKKGVNKETAAKILKIAKDTGYLSENRIDKIRLVIYKKTGQILSTTPFFDELVEGIESECKANGLNLIITNLSAASYEFEEDLRMILDDRSTAVLLLATEMAKEDAEVFTKAAAPLVMLDSWFGHLGLDSVLIDNMDSVSMAVDYLAENGIKRIGYLRSNILIQNFAERYYGYQKGMLQNNLPMPKEDTISLYPSLDGSYRDMKTWLEEHNASGKTAVPEAFLVDNDVIALGAMKALKEQHYKIPEEVSVIGFDNLNFGEIASPPLTTIHVYKQEMGRAAVRKLLDNMNNKDACLQKIQICTSLIERASVKKN